LNPTYHTLKQIASFVQFRYHQMQILLEKVQCQKNSDDCGVYALAFLTDLCYRVYVDPSMCNYVNSQDLQ